MNSKPTTLKRVVKPALVLGAVVAVAATTWLLLTRGCSAGPELAPGYAGQKIPDGWQAAPVVKTPWLPFKENEASEYTREFPAGSRVVIARVGDQEVEFGILPDGTIVGPVDAEYTVTVYEKRPGLFALEARPFVGGGLSTGGPAAVVGVDVVRCWRLHAGPGVAVSYWPKDKDEERDIDVAAVGAASFNAWRNVDLVAYGGYGTAGKIAGGGVDIVIE